MKLFGVSFDIEDALQTVVTGAASTVGFAFGGPAGGALLGGAASGIWGFAEGLGNGKGFGDAMTAGVESAVIGGLAGAIPGGMAGGGVKGLLHSVGDIGFAIAAKRGGAATAREAMEYAAKASMPRAGFGAFTSGVGTALANQFFNPNDPSWFADKPAETPKPNYQAQMPTTFVDVIAPAAAPKTMAA
ncbi:hypothetical protein ACFQZZ_24395 [Nocardia sp. GCM10030253]|uniref:hypothetical protein n=1 Tax=Nocardia sp. GCM10030253 TaxID=3273404 RepID=UPI0036375F8D